MHHMIVAQLRARSGTSLHFLVLPCGSCSAMRGCLATTVQLSLMLRACRRQRRCNPPGLSCWCVPKRQWTNCLSGQRTTTLLASSMWSKVRQDRLGPTSVPSEPTESYNRTTPASEPSMQDPVGLKMLVPVKQLSGICDELPETLCQNAAPTRCTDSGCALWPHCSRAHLLTLAGSTICAQDRL